MGRDASVQLTSEEDQTFDTTAKDGMIYAVGDAAVHVKDKAQDMIEIVKEKAHEASETIKWQAEEVRDGILRRMSHDGSQVIIPVLPPIPEEPVLVPMTPISKDPFTSVATPIVQEPSVKLETGEVAPSLPPRPAEFKTTSSGRLQIAIEPENDLSREIISEPVVTMHVPSQPANFTQKAFAALDELEVSSHNARLKADNFLKQRFGVRAERVQDELEKTRLNAIAGTARFAEILQAQFRKCAMLLHDQQHPPVAGTAAPAAPAVLPAVAPVITAPVVVSRGPGLPPLTPRPPMVGEQKSGGLRGNVLPQSSFESKQSVENTVHNARVDIDNALEHRFGTQAAKAQSEGEKARERAIAGTAHIADLLQEQFGMVASTLREQEQHGAVPVYH